MRTWKLNVGAGVLTLGMACAPVDDFLTDNSPKTDGSGRLAGLYAVAPAPLACMPGKLAMDVQNRTVAYLNGLRARHRLPPVEFSPADEARLQAAALIRMANAGDSSYDVHHPTTAQKCHTPEGAAASADANLFLSAGNQTGVIGEPSRFMDEWLLDKGIANVGHRRFLLDPFLKKIALGLVDGEALIPVGFNPVVGAALQISHPDTNVIPAELTYVAYPEGPYPTKLFDKAGVLNFSVIPGPTRDESAMVSFASATVAITGNGAPLVASGVSNSSEGLGLFNNIQWRVAGLVDGVTYTVAISGVTVKGAPKNYSYTFSLVP